MCLHLAIRFMNFTAMLILYVDLISIHKLTHSPVFVNESFKRSRNYEERRNSVAWQNRWFILKPIISHIAVYPGQHRSSGLRPTTFLRRANGFVSLTHSVRLIDSRNSSGDIRKLVHKTQIYEFQEKLLRLVMQLIYDNTCLRSYFAIVSMD